VVLTPCGAMWHKVTGPVRHGPHPTDPVTLCQIAPQKVNHFHRHLKYLRFQKYPDALALRLEDLGVISDVLASRPPDTFENCKY
jgi:hypothetical protein